MIYDDDMMWWWIYVMIWYYAIECNVLFNNMLFVKHMLHEQVVIWNICYDMILAIYM